MKLRMLNVALTVFVPAIVLLSSLALANYYRLGQYFTATQVNQMVFSEVFSGQFV